MPGSRMQEGRTADRLQKEEYAKKTATTVQYVIQSTDGEGPIHYSLDALEEALLSNGHQLDKGWDKRTLIDVLKHMTEDDAFDDNRRARVAEMLHLVRQETLQNRQRHPIHLQPVTFTIKKLFVQEPGCDRGRKGRRKSRENQQQQYRGGVASEPEASDADMQRQEQRNGLGDMLQMTASLIENSDFFSTLTSYDADSFAPYASKPSVLPRFDAHPSPQPRQVFVDRSPNLRLSPTTKVRSASMGVRREVLQGGDQLQGRKGAKEERTEEGGSGGTGAGSEDKGKSGDGDLSVGGTRSTPSKGTERPPMCERTRPKRAGHRAASLSSSRGGEDQGPNGGETAGSGSRRGSSLGKRTREEEDDEDERSPKRPLCDRCGYGGRGTPAGAKQDVSKMQKTTTIAASVWHPPDLFQLPFQPLGLFRHPPPRAATKSPLPGARSKTNPGPVSRYAQFLACLVLWDIAFGQETAAAAPCDPNTGADTAPLTETVEKAGNVPPPEIAEKTETSTPPAVPEELEIAPPKVTVPKAKFRPPTGAKFVPPSVVVEGLEESAPPTAVSEGSFIPLTEFRWPEMPPPRQRTQQSLEAVERAVMAIDFPMVQSFTPRGLAADQEEDGYLNTSDDHPAFSRGRGRLPGLGQKELAILLAECEKATSGGSESAAQKGRGGGARKQQEQTAGPAKEEQKFAGGVGEVGATLQGAKKPHDSVTETGEGFAGRTGKQKPPVFEGKREDGKQGVSGAKGNKCAGETKAQAVHEQAPSKPKKPVKGGPKHVWH